MLGSLILSLFNPTFGATGGIDRLEDRDGAWLLSDGAGGSDRVDDACRVSARHGVAALASDDWLGLHAVPSAVLVAAIAAFGCVAVRVL